MSLKIWLKDKEKEMNIDSNDAIIVPCTENNMVNNMKIFSNVEFGSIRTVIINHEYWFVGKDVADKLGYQNGSRDINRHVLQEDRIKDMVFDGKQKKETILINESGLYALIFGSKLESAKHFKHWVTSEVLPTIHKTGGYVNNVQLMVESYFGNLPEQQKFLITGLLTNINSLQNSNKELKSENNKLSTENEALTDKCLEWADRPLINALVRAYATSLAGGYGAAWNKFKKELLYKYNIGINARISNHEKETGRKPKTLDMLHDDEIVDATNTIVSMCKENNVKIDELLQNKAKAS